MHTLADAGGGGVSAHLGGLDVPSDRVPLLGAMWSGAIAGGGECTRWRIGRAIAIGAMWSGAMVRCHGCHLIGRRCHCWMQ